LPNVRHSIERFFTAESDSRPEIVPKPASMRDLASAPNRTPVSQAAPTANDGTSSSLHRRRSLQPLAAKSTVTSPVSRDQETTHQNAATVAPLLPPTAIVAPRVVTLTTESSDGQAPEERARAAVATRRGLFKVMYWAASPLLQMAHDRTSIDADKAVASAARIQSLANMIAEVYAVDTRPFPVETQSLDKIWTDPRGFDLDIDELAKAAYALTSAARTHDNEAIVQAASQVGAACAACHDAYRKPLGQP
jgi:cytochrome c556